MPKTKPQRLADPPRLFRGGIARGLGGTPTGVARIDRAGGMFGAGLIRGFAVITRGEALGHGLWIDGEFLRQTAAGINAAPDGVRARFTHPGMSGDGLGKKLGRVKAAREDGDVVRADLHFSKASHATPEGDLATYVMDLAEEDPGMFGASIVFEHDADAEDAFVLKHGGHAAFKSPDEGNAKNLPHARLAALRAADVVDEPAANPSGMFHATDIPADAERLCEYAFGLTEDRPVGSAFGIDLNRLRGFVARYMSRHGLSLKPLSAAPAASANEPRRSADPAWKPHTDRFGTDAGKTWFGLGLTVEQATKLHGTALGNRMLAFDPAAEPNGCKAAGLFHLSADTWAQVAPPADREQDGRRYWRMRTLARWAAAGCPGRNGRPQPEWLAASGGVGPDDRYTPRELALGSRRQAAIADGIKLPGRGK